MARTYMHSLCADAEADTSEDGKIDLDEFKARECLAEQTKSGNRRGSIHPVVKSFVPNALATTDPFCNFAISIISVVFSHNNMSAEIEIIRISNNCQLQTGSRNKKPCKRHAQT